MKKLLVTLLLVPTLLGAAIAGENGDWLTNYEKALEVAKKENKVVLINFTGSDWCGWCKRLEREVFAKDSFEKFAGDKLVLLKVDFPKYSRPSKEQMEANERLRVKYRVPGFPTIFLVNPEEKVLLQTGYVPGGADNYVKHLSESIN